MSTPPICDSAAKLAAHASKAVTLYEPSTTVAKAAVPEAWFLADDPAAMERLLAGAIAVWGTGGAMTFGHVPTANVYRRTGSDFEIRVAWDGGDSGEWMSKDGFMSAIYRMVASGPCRRRGRRRAGGAADGER